MAELHAEQNEKAFQKQDAVFVGRKRVLGKKSGKKGMRYSKNVGLGFKTPETASEGQYVDKKCPFTGNVSIRGRILKGLVVSNKMKRTIVVRRDYLHYVKKFRRFEKRHRTIAAHCSPAFLTGEGDVVTIGQCRPLSKTVRFNVLDVEKCMNKALNVKKAFRMARDLPGCPLASPSPPTPVRISLTTPTTVLSLLRCLVVELRGSWVLTLSQSFPGA